MDLVSNELKLLKELVLEEEALTAAEAPAAAGGRGGLREILHHIGWVTVRVVNLLDQII